MTKPWTQFQVGQLLTLYMLIDNFDKPWAGAKTIAFGLIALTICVWNENRND